MTNNKPNGDSNIKNNVYKGNMDEYELIDFSGMFEGYIKQYVKENNIDADDDAFFEDTVADMYLEWLEAYNEQLLCKPIDYFKLFNDSQLIQILIKYVMAHIKLPDPLIEEIILRKENTAPLIVKVFEFDDGSHFSLDIRLTGMNILSEMQYPIPMEKYMSFIEKGDEEDTLAQMAYEIIDEQIEEKDYATIIAAYDNTSSQYAKNTYLDIMSRFYGNSEAYDRLVQAFISNVESENVAFYATCLAKFGDDRAISVLEKVLKENEFDYINFTAIKFAIEQLGDDINIDKVFDGDSAYELLKNMKVD